MSSQFFNLAFINIVVAIDNSLLAGIILPRASQKYKRQIMVIVGIALGFTQIILSLGVGQLLSNPLFRAIAVVILVWMTIRTLVHAAFPHRTSGKLSVIWNVFFYTTIGNLDNMIWLGAELKGHTSWLVFFSLATIPLFIIAAIFLSQQCERHQWILIAGAGMMAWAAAALVLQTPGWNLKSNVIPTWVMQVAIASFILMIGFLIREFVIHVPRPRI